MIQSVPDNWNAQQDEQLHDVQLDANTIVYNLPALIQTTELLWGTGGEPNPIDLHGDGRGRGRADGNPPPPQAAVGGTLESVVNQSATIQPPPPPATSKSGRRRHVPWSRRAARASSDSSSLQPVPVAVDALVPCNNSTNKGGPGSDGTWSATQGGSCSAAAEKGHPRGSTTTFETESRQLTAETGELEMISHGFTFTSNSIGSLGNTSSAANQTTNNDSASHSINERDDQIKTSQVSMKKNRAAAVHNQSERKRRDRINEKMKTLQNMVPNASKTDKASMLDEVIDYLKQLQAQISLMTRMPSILMQQQLQLMSMMGMGMNMGLAGMGITGAGGPMVPPPNMAAGNILPPYMNPFMSPSGWEGIIDHGSEVPMQVVPTGLEAPVPNPFNVFLSRQQAEAPNAMESAARMTALYQQYQQFQQIHGA